MAGGGTHLAVAEGFALRGANQQHTIHLHTTKVFCEETDGGILICTKRMYYGGVATYGEEGHVWVWERWKEREEEVTRREAKSGESGTVGVSAVVVVETKVKLDGVVNPAAVT